MTAHILELKQTIEKQKKESSQLEKQMDEIRRQLSVKDRHVEEEREKHKAAILLLEEQKLDSKKHNVLELEMAAYEVIYFITDVTLASHCLEGVTAT